MVGDRAGGGLESGRESLEAAVDACLLGVVERHRGEAGHALLEAGVLQSQEALRGRRSQGVHVYLIYYYYTPLLAFQSASVQIIYGSWS